MPGSALRQHRRGQRGQSVPSTARPPATRRIAVPCRRASRLDRRQHLRAALAPRIELVRRARLPRLDRLVALAVEPVRAPELVVRLDQIRAERERLLEEGLRVLEHVPLEVHQSKIEVRVQRRLLVVVEPNRPREVLDRLAEDALLQADVPDVDARQRVLRLPHQHLLEVHQRVVVLLLQHLRPAEQRLRLRVVRGRAVPSQRRLRAGVVAEREIVLHPFSMNVDAPMWSACTRGRSPE